VVRRHEWNGVIRKSKPSSPSGEVPSSSSGKPEIESKLNIKNEKVLKKDKEAKVNNEMKCKDCPMCLVEKKANKESLFHSPEMKREPSNVAKIAKGKNSACNQWAKGKMPPCAECSYMKKRGLTIYTREHVARHCYEDSCWMIANGVVYDATSFLYDHPAGSKSILRKGGKDATRDLNFHSRSAKRLWEKYRIGVLEGYSNVQCIVC